MFLKIKIVIAVKNKLIHYIGFRNKKINMNSIVNNVSLRRNNKLNKINQKQYYYYKKQIKFLR